MLIKLNLEGELLENLLKDAKTNCRTNPMQIIYYLQEIYKGNIIVLSNDKQGTNRELTEYENKPVSTDKNNESTLKHYISTSKGKSSTQRNIEQLQKQVDNLGDDIIDW